MRLFASSDHHFYHRNIIKYVNRPFDFNDPNCVVDNAKLMIERHNEVVTNDDVVLIVGDLSAGLKGRREHYKKLIPLLNGKKILIRGNHDHEPDQFYLDAGIIGVYDYIQVKEYFICHYPCYLSEWTSKKEKRYIDKICKDTTTIIHGHVHNKDPSLWKSDGFNRINVSVDYDPNNYYPQELKDQVLIDHFINTYE